MIEGDLGVPIVLVATQTARLVVAIEHASGAICKQGLLSVSSNSIQAIGQLNYPDESIPGFAVFVGAIRCQRTARLFPVLLLERSGSVIVTTSAYRHNEDGTISASIHTHRFMNARLDAVIEINIPTVDDIATQYLWFTYTPDGHAQLRSMGISYWSNEGSRGLREVTAFQADGKILLRHACSDTEPFQDFDGLGEIVIEETAFPGGDSWKVVSSKMLSGFSRLRKSTAFFVDASTMAKSGGSFNPGRIVLLQRIKRNDAPWWLVSQKSSTGWVRETSIDFPGWWRREDGDLPCALRENSDANKP